MRFVDRQSVPPPEVFATPEARATRAALGHVFGASARKMAQSRVGLPEGGYSVTGDERLEDALMALFAGRCAFCESALKRPMVHRFRPSGAAEPVQNIETSHLYYVWLAEAWQNLYPICPDCAPEADIWFPVYGRRCELPRRDQVQVFADLEEGIWPDYPPRERPVLLDPCQDRQLWRHLRFRLNGEAVGLTRRGRETIAHFRLNRAALVASRANAIARAVTIVRSDTMTIDPGWVGTVHPGAVALFLREVFGRALGRRSGDLAKQAAALFRRPDGEERFQRAVAAMEREAAGAPEPGTEPQPEPAQGEEPDSLISVRLTNFKSLERIDLTLPAPPEHASAGPEAPSLLILGENATGKSTILEAIALGVMPPEARARLKFNPGRAVLNPKYMGAPEQVMPLQAVIEVTHSGGTRRLTLTHRQTHAREIKDRGAAPAIAVFAYGAFRQYLDKTRNFTAHKHVRSLFETDEILSNPEAWLAGLDQPHFDMVVRALREVFNIDGSFDVIERDDDGIFVVSQPDGAGQTQPRREPISLVSSGFRAVLAMLCDIMQGLMDRRVNPGFQALETARGLVLIDEVEAHLHPRWKLSIMTGLRRALPRVSFIATSHDPLCLRGMGAHEVMVLERVAGAAGDTDLPVFTQTLTDLPDNGKWTVEQLLTADFFQLRSTESLEAERRAARMEDKLARGVTPEEDAELRAYLEEFCRDLPIGHSEVHRLVQAAIASYLRERRDATRDKLARLRQATREAIVHALKSVG